jgi:hypothetical protein
MRITISHNQSKAEVVQSVDRSFNDLFQEVPKFPVRLVVEEKNWQGSTLSFSLTAKLGLVNAPLRGTIEVTDKHVTIDVDLGILERFIPVSDAREAIGNRIRGLLK